MQVLVRAKNFIITKAIQAFSEQQAGKLTKKFKRIIRVETFLETTRSKAKATVKAVIPGKDIVVEKEGDNVYQAIQASFNKIARALRKKGERTKSHKK